MKKIECFTNGGKLKIYHWFELSHPYTFRMPKLYRFIRDRCDGKVLFPFAGPTRIKDIDGIYIDINPEMHPDIIDDAINVDALFPRESFDTIVVDPPWGQLQSNVLYKNSKMPKIQVIKYKLHELLKPGGRYIQVGWSSSGMALKKGYERMEIALICCGGRNRDIIVVVERKIQRKLFA